MLIQRGQTSPNRFEGKPRVIHCKRDTYNLNRYIYGGRSAIYTRHLAKCPQCQARPLNLCPIGCQLIALGNPYQVPKDGNRNEVISKHKLYLIERMAKDKQFYNLVMSARGKDIGCWCAPDSCHCDVILLLANEVDRVSELLGV